MRSRTWCCLAIALTSSAFADGWYATRVVSYTAGTGASAGHRNPQSALGEPARMTGMSGSIETITPFQPAYMPDQIVSIGAGGSLVVELGTPATDDPGHRFGIDLIVYGNAFFSDMGYPAGVPGYCAGEGGLVDVSGDGVNWTNVPGVVVDGPMPAMAWIDAGPYDTVPGSVPTDFLRAMNPAIKVSDLVAIEYADVITAYDGSAGGAGVDLASVGLSNARYVRFRHPLGATGSPEIDAVAVVPPTPSRFDLDGSGSEDFGDIAFLLISMGDTNGPCDVDESGLVDFGDIALLLLEMN